MNEIPPAPVDLYVLGATCLYLLPMLALAGWSLVATVVDWAGLRRALTPGDWWLMGAVAGVQGLLVVVAAVCFALDDDTRLLALGAVANTISVAAALAIYPMAMARHREAVATRPDPATAWPFVVPAWWMAGALAWGLIVVWSVVWMAGIQLSGIEIKVAEQFADIGSSPLNWVLLVPLALLAAVVEEIIFRLGMQGLIERVLRAWDPRGVVAIAASTLVWTLGHAANATPHGLKEIHIVVVGVVLGRVMQTHGLRAAIAAHLGLNAMALAMSGVAAMLGLEP